MLMLRLEMQSLVLFNASLGIRLLQMSMHAGYEGKTK